MTEEELNKYFPEHLEELKKERSDISPDVELLVRDEYLGYCWEGNSFLLIALLEVYRYGDRWIRDGTWTFSMKLVSRNNYSAFDIENIKLISLKRIVYPIVEIHESYL